MGLQYNHAAIKHRDMETTTNPETWRLYEVIDSYDDGTYGAEHIGNRFDDEYQTPDPQAFVVPWQHEDGSVLDLTANVDLDIVLPSGRVIATWQPSAYDC